MSVLSSLTNRVFVASASLVVLSIGLAIYRVSASVAEQAERDLRLGLAEAASLVDDLSRTQFADFVVKGQLIADLPKLPAAAATEDPPTVQPIVEEYQARIRADLFLVFGRTDRLLARAGRLSIAPEEASALLAAARRSRDGTLFWPVPGGVLHVAAIPMEAGLSTVLLGSSLDQQTAARIHAITNSDIAFVFDSRVVATSLDVERAGALAAVANRTGQFTVELDREDYVGLARPLSDDPATGPTAIVLRSRTEHLRFLPTLQWHIAVTGLAAVFVATFVAYLVARSVTRPLRALTGTMREIAVTGDLERAMPPVGRFDDEDVRVVTTTFRQLTGALDRFRHEAALRDRLSSLGRLSAVVAHEVRNPLMIIKSAVRRLRRSDDPGVAEVAASIDEEVARLDRVVAGVLDVARPITFEFAPADLVEICREAVAAAMTSTPAVPIVTELDVASAEVLTDRERVRSVLVNVLDNAQQAVGAREPRDAGGPAIVLRLVRAPGATWRITVRDTGPGIAPDDLPRIFEPFFTTRRRGSGLGLAIARNVVEGLGGTIRAESQVGEGTTVIVDLPDRRPAAEEGS